MNTATATQRPHLMEHAEPEHDRLAGRSKDDAGSTSRWMPGAAIDATPITRVTAGVSRRTALRLGGGALALGLLAGRGFPAAARQVTPGTTAPPTGQAYVGVADDGVTAVALVVDRVEARAYLCDGRTVNAWLTGTAHGRDLRLTGADGAELFGTLVNGAIRGTAALPDGTELRFAAAAAAGIAGLYDVVLGEGGRIAGAASDGRRLVGGVARELADGSRLVAALIEAPDGTARPVAAVATADAAGEQRWIVQADGTVVGAAKAGSGTGFADGSVRIQDGTSNTFFGSFETK